MTGLRCALFLLALGLLGCGPAEPKCIPVSGKVTLDGGPVPGAGYIYFNPSDADQAGLMRPGTAEFDAQGNYKAKTFKADDGLLPGKYKLRVDCWKTPPNMEGKPVVSHVPGKYQDAAKSELELTVESNSKGMVYNIDLKSK